MSPLTLHDVAVEQEERVRGAYRYGLSGVSVDGQWFGTRSGTQWVESYHLGLIKAIDTEMFRGVVLSRKRSDAWRAVTAVDNSLGWFGVMPRETMALVNAAESAAEAEAEEKRRAWADEMRASEEARQARIAARRAARDLELAPIREARRAAFLDSPAYIERLLGITDAPRALVEAKRALLKLKRLDNPNRKTSP